MTRRWVEIVARECPQDFLEDIDSMVATASKLDSIANMDELMRQKGFLKALSELRLKVSNAVQSTTRRR